MNSLFRELAPISSAAWGEIESEAKRTLKTSLAARKLVEFKGPLGLETSSINTGRRQAIGALERGAETSIRESQPLVEVRVPFELKRADLDSIERGADDADLDPVIAAAQQLARIEDRAAFHGYPAAMIQGICEGAPGGAVPLSDDFGEYPVAVARAISRLHAAGVEGPFAIALSKQCYIGITETTKGGYPVIQHVKRLLDGPIVWAPALDGAVVLSMRGEDFELIVGQDISIGYLDHDREKVRLYLQESFTFRVLSPQAAVPLAYEKKGGAKKGK
ncbi:MAG: family 1 encapsulin nanocompartment shell protein [Alphaproteobacteria bacterium]